MTLHVGVSTFNPGEVGAYTLSSTVVNESEEQCDIAFLIAGISTTQTISNTDCAFNANPLLKADVFILQLRAGMTVTFHMSSTSTVDPFLELYGGPNGDLLVSNDNANANTRDADIRYTAQTSGYYFIAARPAVVGQVGLYDLSFVLNGSSSTFGQGNSSTEARHPAKGRGKLPWSAHR
jgi:hypothetical protein